MSSQIEAPDVFWRRLSNRFVVAFLTYRWIFVVLFQTLLVVCSNYVAFWLRFDGQIPAGDNALFTDFLPILILVRTVMFFPFRLHEGLWRYVSLWDLKRILGSVFFSTLLFFLIVHSSWGITSYPRSIFITDSVLLVCLLSGVRMTRRMVREFNTVNQTRRVIIFGAGDAGEMVVRDMKNNPSYKYRPIGFVDDDKTKVGLRIHGVKVLGTRERIPKLVADLRPDELLIAMPAANAQTLRSVIQTLERFKLPIKTLPSLSVMLASKPSVRDIRNLAIEDLLPRAPVGLDPLPIQSLVAGKRVLVTGAGGSIGSELSRQIAALSPATIILLDQYENGLFAVANDLKITTMRTETVIADITDGDRVNSVFSQFKPHLVFHAAAHKHVPLMELNPTEAVKNNIRGTRILIDAAIRHEVQRFVLISTDKAVNPSSVMGASKRIAELLTLCTHANNGAILSVVRFGNVLGSNGSVVPTFLSQIREGGPVTLTHPDMKRYFMLIPEAVQLLLHAAAHAEQQTIHLLQMGDEIKVLELARNLIRLSGFIPEQDIPITFVGLRPGEKLSEQLFGDDEDVEPSAVVKVLRVRPKTLPEFRFLMQAVSQLERVADEGDSDAVIEIMKNIVPTYVPAPVSRRAQPLNRAASTH